MHPRIKQRVVDIAEEKINSAEKSIVLRFKTIALISEVGFIKTGMPEFRNLSDVAMSVVAELAEYPPITAKGLLLRTKIRDELKNVQGLLDDLVRLIEHKANVTEPSVAV